MTPKSNLLAYAVLSCVLAAQVASAQLVTNKVKNTQSMGLSYNFATATAAQQGGSSPWKPSARNQATPVGAPTTGMANKIWLDFDLASAWATYGKGNLVSATLTLWGENGPTRRFDVAGLNDGTAGETTWTAAGLSWANAPGNDVTSGHLFHSSMMLYSRTAVGTAGVGDAGVSTLSQDPTTAADTLYDQCARYTSTNISSFLSADSNGRVTIMISDGAFNDNQNFWTGVGGSYDVANPIYFTAGGDVIRDSPTLTLVFTNASVTVKVPVFTNVMRVGNNLVLQGTNGPANGVYQMLRSDDVTLVMGDWFETGVQNFDANGNFSFTSPMPVDDANFYRVLVLSSDPVIAPGITAHPQDLAIGVGNTANFSVAATGTAPLTYRWYFNTNTLLQSGLSAALTIPNAQVANSGTISVTVSNLAGATNSVLATLTVTNSTEPARIVTQPPTSLNANVGQTVNFGVTAAGALPLRYQWYFNTNTVLAGQTNSALTLSNLQLTNAGQYSVTVTNLFGSTNSTFVTLTVNSNASSELIGWAAVAGNGLTTTTGGGNATPILATNIAHLKSLASDGTPRVIQLSGTYVTGSSPVEIANNKTLIGVDKFATIQGGINVSSGRYNIIVKNLNILGVGVTAATGSPVDAIAVRSAHHIWFDHLNIADGPDGNLDLTIGTDYVTVSWCKFWYTTPGRDHRLSNLIGNSSTATATDTGKNNVTYHHNWFSTNVDQRMPRGLFGNIHIFNSYYNAPGNSYCIGSGSWASILVENNYFKNVKSPHQSNDGNPSYIVATGNVYDATTGNQHTGLLNADPSGNPVPFTPPYTYTLDAAANIPSIVTQGAGPP